MKQENEEKTVTAVTAVESILTAVLVVAGVVAVFALIWGRWYAFRVSLTVVAVLLMAAVIYAYVSDKFTRE